MKYILLPICLILAGNCLAQSDISRIKIGIPIANSDSLLSVGAELYDNKKYEEAVSEFEKVNENDSSYIDAQFNIASCYLSMKEYDKTIELCDRILKTDKSYYPKALILKGNAYDGMKNFQASEETYRKGIAEFPYSAKFFHELAISFYNQKRHKEAYDEFIKAISVNPQYSPSHYYLAILSLRQKDVVQTMLGLQYYLLLDNNTTRARYAVNFLEQIGDDAVNYDELEIIPAFSHDDAFDDLEAIIKSKAAYSSKFKSKVKFNYRMLKQMQVVVDEVKYDPNDKNFHNQFYARFFSELSQKNFTETYLCYSLSGFEVPEAKKWVKSNNDKVSALGDWISDYLSEMYPSEMAENPEKKCLKTYSGININSIGPFDNKKTRTGYWKYFYPSSRVKSEGAYANGGKKNGPWKYYHDNGTLRESCVFTDDVITGDYYEYYANGHPKSHLIYVNGKLEGKQSIYHSNGNLKNTYTYKNGVIEGEEMGFFETGKKEYQAIVAAGNYAGTYESFFENGHPRKVFTLENGLKKGPGKEFFNYPKGAVYQEGNFENNNQSGEWKSYYYTGQMYQTGVFNKNGMKTGLWKTFDEKGTLIDEDRYADGRFEGESKKYYDNGKTYEEFFYRKNKVNLYKYYDQTGKLVKEITKQKNDFNLELYNRNGTLRLTGNVQGDQFDGVITDYNYLGIKSKTTEYKNDQPINKQLMYYSNGRLMSETPYTNGKENGLYTQYFVDGTVLSKGYYVNGMAEGYWFYYERTGTLSEIRFYSHNDKTGWQRIFSCNGKLFREERIDDGRIAERYYYDTLGKVIKYIDYDACNDCEVSIPSIAGFTWIKRHLKNNYINGTSVTYYPNGKTEDDLVYDMDMITGTAKKYDLFGNLQAETNYDFDRKQGLYTSYKNGKVEYTAMYRNNELHGEAKDYYDSGKLYRTISYQYNNNQGPTTIYDESGAVAVVLNYNEDDFVSYSYENESGKLIDPIVIDKPDMTVKAFYKNKKPSMVFTLKNGEREGAFVIYSSSGTKLFESEYKDGYIHGPRTEYYSSGKVKSKCVFRYGELQGLFTEYNENGTLRSEFNFMGGERHGISKYYDGNGKLLMECFFYDDNAIKIIK